MINRHRKVVLHPRKRKANRARALIKSLGCAAPDDQSMKLLAELASNVGFATNAGFNPSQARDPHGRWAAAQRSQEALRASRVAGDPHIIDLAGAAAIASDRAMDSPNDPLVIAARHQAATIAHTRAREAHDAALFSLPRNERPGSSHETASEQHQRAASHHIDVVYAHGGSLFGRATKAHQASMQAFGLSIPPEGRTDDTGVKVIDDAFDASFRRGQEPINDSVAAEAHRQAAAFHIRYANRWLPAALRPLAQHHRTAAELHEEVAKYHDELNRSLTSNVATLLSNYEGQERDILGRFAPKGQGEAKGSGWTPVGKVKKPPKRVDFSYKTFKYQLKQLPGFEHAVKEYVTSRVERNVMKMPEIVQDALGGAWWFARLGTRAAFASWTASQALAERIARRAGLRRKEAAKLRSKLMSADILATKPVLGAGEVAGIAAPGLFAASMVPPATAAYILYSTARHPIATARAAGDMIHKVVKGVKKGAKKAIPVRYTGATPEKAKYAKPELMKYNAALNTTAVWCDTELPAHLREYQSRARTLPVVNANGGGHYNPNQPRDPHGRWRAAQTSQRALQHSLRASAPGDIDTHAKERAKEAAIASDRALDAKDPVTAANLHDEAAQAHILARNAHWNVLDELENTTGGGVNQGGAAILHDSASINHMIAAHSLRNYPESGPPDVPPGWVDPDKTTHNVVNVFCPTGEGGGIDPTCPKTREEAETYDRARERAGGATARATRASDAIPYRDSTTRGAKKHSQRAAILSDRAMAAPAHLAEKLHGEAADAHFRAQGRHARASNQVSINDPRYNLHNAAMLAHYNAGNRHLEVSGRTEAAHQLTLDAIKASQATGATGHTVLSFHSVENASRDRRHGTAGSMHRSMQADHEYLADNTINNAQRRLHRAAATAHRTAERAHNKLFHGPTHNVTKLTPSQTSNIFCPTGPGGGIDPTCRRKNAPAHPAAGLFAAPWEDEGARRGLVDWLLYQGHEYEASLVRQYPAGSVGYTAVRTVMGLPNAAIELDQRDRGSSGVGGISYNVNLPNPYAINPIRREVYSRLTKQGYILRHTNPPRGSSAPGYDVYQKDMGPGKLMRSVLLYAEREGWLEGNTRLNITVKDFARTHYRARRRGLYNWDIYLPPTGNIFCPTGEGGGIDPSCTYDQSFEMHRQRASEASARAIAATRRVAHTNAEISATEAAVASDRAVSAPGHKAQELHGEAADRHFDAARRHLRFQRALRGSEFSNLQERATRHAEAHTAHQVAAIAHELVSGRREQARQLTEEAHKATQNVSHWNATAESSSNAARSAARGQQHVAAAGYHFNAGSEHDYIAGQLQGFDQLNDPNNPSVVSHRQAAQAHYHASRAHYRLARFRGYDVNDRLETLEQRIQGHNPPTGNRRATPTTNGRSYTLAPLSHKVSVNIFCPTGEGGGIDPTCTHSEVFERGRQDASAHTLRALEQTRHVASMPGANVTVLRRAQQSAEEAGVASDRAMESPAAHVQQRHGEAADKHFAAAQQHYEAAGHAQQVAHNATDLNTRRLAQDLHTAHTHANRLHYAAGMTHEHVSGRREEARRLSEEAHSTTTTLRSRYPNQMINLLSESRHAVAMARAGNNATAASQHFNAASSMRWSSDQTTGAAAEEIHRGAMQHYRASLAHYNLVHGMDVEEHKTRVKRILQRYDDSSNVPRPPTGNIFCPTGKGGGIVPTCTKQGAPAHVEGLFNAPLDDELARRSLIDWLEQHGHDADANLLRPHAAGTNSYLGARMAMGLPGAAEVEWRPQLPTGGREQFTVTMSSNKALEAARREIHDRALARGFTLYRSRVHPYWNHNGADRYHLDRGPGQPIKVITVDFPPIHGTFAGWDYAKNPPLHISVQDWNRDIYDWQGMAPPKRPRRLKKRPTGE